jgi:hypothetical protein
MMVEGQNRSDGIWFEIWSGFSRQKVVYILVSKEKRMKLELS